MRNVIYLIVLTMVISSCSIYRSYHRPDNLPVDSIYRSDMEIVDDSLTFGDLSWKELFTDPFLQNLIKKGLENNADLQIALLRLDEAKAQLKAAKLAFLPSFTLSPQGTITRMDGGSTTKTYELPLQAGWEVDLFGSLRNARKGTQAALLRQEAYRQVTQSELIASIANGYYSLLLLDEQIYLSASTMEVWREQVRTMEIKLRVGEENENAVSQAKASLYELEATHNDLIRQQHETENALCILIGMTPREIERGDLSMQKWPKEISVGVPLRLLSKRPDVLQAEMELASAYYTTNQARSAFYPNITLTGSAGWTNSLGQAVTNPGSWILSAIGSLTQPIFKRGELTSNLRVSKDEEQIALINYRQTLLEAGKEVTDALYAIESVQKTLESHEKQVGELEKAVHMSESLYETGNATYLELLTARQSLLNARLNVVSDRFSSLQSLITLYNALGGGIE